MYQNACARLSSLTVLYTHVSLFLSSRSSRCATHFSPATKQASHITHSGSLAMCVRDCCMTQSHTNTNSNTFSPDQRVERRFIRTHRAITRIHQIAHTFTIKRDIQSQSEWLCVACFDDDDDQTSPVSWVSFAGSERFSLQFSSSSCLFRYSLLLSFRISPHSYTHISIYLVYHSRNNSSHQP